MAYDDAALRRSSDEQPSGPAAYRANTLAEVENPRTADLADPLATDGADGRTPGAEPEDDGRDRLGIHLGWEVVLLLGVAALAFLLYRFQPEALKRPALDTLMVAGAALGLLTV